MPDSKDSLEERQTSELSVRDADDDYISASAEDLAGSIAKPSEKKTVKFKELSSESASSKVEDDHEFVKGLASVQDFTNLGRI
jgi:hypothetical protein